MQKRIAIGMIFTLIFFAACQRRPSPAVSGACDLGGGKTIKTNYSSPRPPDGYLSKSLSTKRHCSKGTEALVLNDNTSRTSYLAIVAALVAAAVVSSVWYSPLLFGKQWMELSGISSTATGNSAIPAWKMLIDLVREFVVISVLARLITGLRIVDWKGAVKLGFWVWLGFPVQMLAGASLWDNKPWLLDLIHAGDWLMKMLVIALILAKWPRVQMAHLQTSS